MGRGQEGCEGGCEGGWEPGDGGLEALGSSLEAAGGGIGLHYQVFGQEEMGLGVWGKRLNTTEFLLTARTVGLENALRTFPVV